VIIAQFSRDATGGQASVEPSGRRGGREHPRAL